MILPYDRLDVRSNQLRGGRRIKCLSPGIGHREKELDLRVEHDECRLESIRKSVEREVAISRSFFCLHGHFIEILLSQTRDRSLECPEHTAPLRGLCHFVQTGNSYDE